MIKINGNTKRKLERERKRKKNGVCKDKPLCESKMSE